MNLKRALIVCIIFGSISFSFIPPSAFSLKISFVPYFANEALILSKKNYVTSAQDTISIDLFKFYVSNISVKVKGQWQLMKNTYHLINAEELSSQNFLIPLKEKTDSIEFLIGVDSLACVSAKMDGDLDPLKAMYWSWNTGYVNAKIEGKSPSSKAVHHAYEFHIGGYRAPFNTLRKVRFKIDGDAIKLKADAAYWFNGKEKTDLKKTNSIVELGKEAVKMADNYKEMFSVIL